MFRPLKNALPQQDNCPGLSLAQVRNAKIVGKACEDWLRRKGLLGQFNLCGNRIEKKK